MRKSAKFALITPDFTDGNSMTGFELRLWRRGLGWSQERAAEELGVSLRTYKTYEKKSPPRMAILATQALERNFPK